MISKVKGVKRFERHGEKTVWFQTENSHPVFLTAEMLAVFATIARDYREELQVFIDSLPTSQQLKDMKDKEKSAKEIAKLESKLAELKKTA